MPDQRFADYWFLPMFQSGDVAALVLKGIKNSELYIYTHPEMRPWLEKRVDRCLVAYRKLGPAPQEIMG